MPDYPAAIEEFSFTKLNDATLLALLASGLDSIYPYAAPADLPGRHIIFGQRSGNIERIINRGDDISGFDALYDFDVWGDIGDDYDDIKDIVSQIETLLHGKSGAATNAFIDACVLEAINSFPDFTQGEIRPRRTLTFRFVAIPN
jgi:hypothetical protein